MRAMTAEKSASVPGGTCTPRSGTLWISPMTRDDRITHFEGTQPKLRQSPPKRCFSIKATRAPRPAPPAAVTSPAVPAPITTRLYRAPGSGFLQSGGWTLDTSTRLCSSLGRTSGIGLTGSLLPRPGISFLVCVAFPLVQSAASVSDQDCEDQPCGDKST